MCFPPHPPVFGLPILFTYRGSAALSRYHGNVLWMDGKSVWLFDGAAASCVVLPWGRAAARHHKRQKKGKGKRKVEAFLLHSGCQQLFYFHFLFFFIPNSRGIKRRWGCGEWCENLEWFHTNARTHAPIKSSKWESSVTDECHCLHANAHLPPAEGSQSIEKWNCVNRRKWGLISS